MKPIGEQRSLAHLFERVRGARRVFVLTGAGVSAESGVPTFRGGGGAAVWKGMPFNVISSAEMIERDLPEVWAWFDYRRSVIERVRPNPAHETLARWQDRFADFVLATQNIDGLHERAGSRCVLELHGSIWRARCLNCEARKDLRADDDGKRPPLCSICGAMMRPDVVLFGEFLPAEVFARAEEAARSCDLCFVIGTSAIVYPAAGLPEIARGAGAYLVEVNPEETPLSALCHESLRGRAGEILPFLDRHIFGSEGVDV
ncbi:SIR2 family NAD-dependent protein deacylase [Pyrinomonas methylaliphatogenes]|uniref:protein acetyllysine N-acetyltransferase n=1 Tax=Pyrinomonas methylaliphatogenes TaxID=454194 RepID=A0A0B6WX27_9BACT|nr:NAD-dependent deacylase [Pyrinomonas methylaliphatogenes]CDM65302.1 NAD-dependent protein deacetylase, SIR2 family [Pyrinomonas methylaliphatogenes]